MDVYSAPLLPPGAPPETGTYATTADRSKAANQRFVAVAEQYGWLPEGTKAHYFAGVTYEEMGQNGPAETELKKAADAWDRNTENLAKLALAGLYHQTNRDAQAIDLYNAIAAKPSTTCRRDRGAAGSGRFVCVDRQTGYGARSVGQGEGRRQGGCGGSDCSAEAVGPVGRADRACSGQV